MHTKSYELGKQAFLDGKSATPAQDVNLQNLMRFACSSYKQDRVPIVKVLDSWIAGWHNANAAAPVDSWSIWAGQRIAEENKNFQSLRQQKT